jgi:hypothetical protein
MHRSGPLDRHAGVPEPKKNLAPGSDPGAATSLARLKNLSSPRGVNRLLTLTRYQDAMCDGGNPCGRPRSAPAGRAGRDGRGRSTGVGPHNGRDRGKGGAMTPSDTSIRRRVTLMLAPSSSKRTLTRQRPRSPLCPIKEPFLTGRSGSGRELLVTG